jgi:hypothetical protein
MEHETTQNDTDTRGGAADDPRPPTAETTEDHTEDPDESGWVTTDVAAAALKRSPRRVREYIRRGLLVAKTEGEGVSKRWLVSINSLNALLNELGKTQGARPEAWPSSKPRPHGIRRDLRADDIAAVGADELLATVQQLQYRLGQAEARAELTEKTESTLREERERLLADLERERERADRLEEELRQARRGWFRRFFGIY